MNRLWHHTNKNTSGKLNI